MAACSQPLKDSCCHHQSCPSPSPLPLYKPSDHDVTPSSNQGVEVLPRSEVEYLVQADGQALPFTDLAHGQEHTGHEADAVKAVGADGELLARVA